MGVHVRCSGVRYAVIQTSSNKDRPERLVIAYQVEDCLRELIAAPSIIGLGFASREEASADLYNPQHAEIGSGTLIAQFSEESHGR